jgi:hypothetical protein
MNNENDSQRRENIPMKSVAYVSLSMIFEKVAALMSAVLPSINTMFSSLSATVKSTAFEIRTAAFCSAIGVDVLVGLCGCVETAASMPALVASAFGTCDGVAVVVCSTVFCS